MDAHAFPDAGGLEEALGGGKNEVLGIGRQKRVVAFEAQLRAVTLEGKSIVEVDRMEDGLQFVEAVGTPAQDVEEEPGRPRLYPAESWSAGY
jgi:hypothetical protein